jgi:hypothetical protein
MSEGYATVAGLVMLTYCAPLQAERERQKKQARRQQEKVEKDRKRAAVRAAKDLQKGGGTGPKRIDPRLIFGPDDMDVVDEERQILEGLEVRTLRILRSNSFYFSIARKTYGITLNPA